MYRQLPLKVPHLKSNVYRLDQVYPIKDIVTRLSITFIVTCHILADLFYCVQQISIGRKPTFTCLFQENINERTLEASSYIGPFTEHTNLCAVCNVHIYNSTCMFKCPMVHIRMNVCIYLSSCYFCKMFRRQSLIAWQLHFFIVHELITRKL